MTINKHDEDLFICQAISAGREWFGKDFWRHGQRVVWESLLYNLCQAAPRRMPPGAALFYPGSELQKCSEKTSSELGADVAAQGLAEAAADALAEVFAEFAADGA